MRVNIIGGGLAGCALAYVLKDEGAEPVIYDAGDALASGASGNDIGLYNPRFTAQMDTVGEYYSTAFSEALKVFEIFGDEVDWNPCGALHLVTDEKKARRFPKTVQSWGWGEDRMRMVSKQEASELAGVEIAYDALFLKESGVISPKKLCHRYAQDIEVHLGTKVDDFGDLEGDVTILACGMGCLTFMDAVHLPLKPVRGQVTYIKESEKTRGLNTTIGFGGYIAPSVRGSHCLGSTFQRWLDHSDLMDEDDVANLDKLFEYVLSLKSDCDIEKSKAGVRAISRDHFPVAGQLGGGDTYISTAHGSHGILSSLLSAKILAKKTVGSQPIISENVLKALSPARFK